MRDFLHWIVVGLAFGIGYMAGVSVYNAVVHLLKGGK